MRILRGRVFRDRLTGYVASFAADSGQPFPSPVEIPGPDETLIEKVNVVTSQCAGFGEGLHLPVIDLDFEAHLEPSTTSGHFHLYLDRTVTAEQLFRLLDVMADVGLVERGYAEASRARGYSSVRLPGVRKEAVGDIPDWTS